MKAIKCRTCGKEHWGLICDGDGPPEVKTVTKPRHKLPAFVTKPSVAVTKPSVATMVNGEAGMKSKAATSQLALMEAEIKQLKRLLAEANAKLAEVHGGRPPIGDKAMSAAERSAKLRAKLRAKKGVTQFEG